MAGEEKTKTEIFNVFSIFIEQTQNIKNYIAAKAAQGLSREIETSSIVCIGKTDEGYFVHAGNMVENRDIPYLKEKLDALSGKSKEELKQLYKEHMKKNLDPEQSGAGMGLIDIARKAAKPVSYSFNPLGSDYSFYEIKVMV